MFLQKIFRKFIFIICLLFFIGCKANNSLDPTNHLEVDFQLKDVNGQQQTSFNFGEDIHFSYSIKNISDGAQSYLNPDTGPFVSFEARQNDQLLGTSDDGLAYALVIVTGSIEPEKEMSFEYNWFANDEHQPLPVGDYQAIALPRLNFDDVATPEPQVINFSVVCDSTEGSCDPITNVMITDLPSNSVQLDRFELNAIEVNGDTIKLDITHSGGCAEHGYELFMSPAAFLESNPVQANLFFKHNENDDACDGLIMTEVSFNLKPIADLHEQFYGRKDQIILNVFQYFEGDPAEHLRVTYLPE